MLHSKRLISLCGAIFVCVALTACGTTPEQRAAAREEFRSKLAGMPVRTYIIYRFHRPLNAPLVPLDSKLNTYVEEETYWQLGSALPDHVVPYDQDSLEKDYCEANGGKLEYIGKVNYAIPVRTVVESRSEYARNNPYAVMTDATRDIYAYNRRVPEGQIHTRFAEQIKKYQYLVDAKKFGKFHCVIKNKAVLFKVSYGPLTISEGDNRPGQIKTELGATVQTEYRFEFK